jgi:hypothetical protein
MNRLAVSGARRDADEQLDVVLKHWFPDEAVANRKTAKSINVARIPYRLSLKICLHTSFGKH